MKKWYEMLVIASWIPFALIVVLVPPVRTGSINAITSVIALVGLVVGLLFFLLKRSVLFSTCVGLGAVVIFLSAAKLWIFVSRYMAVDPDPNVLTAIWFFIKSRIAVPEKLATDGSLLHALAEFYWEFGMPVLQVFIVIVALAWRHKAKWSGEK